MASSLKMVALDSERVKKSLRKNRRVKQKTLFFSLCKFIIHLHCGYCRQLCSPVSERAGRMRKEMGCSEVWNVRGN